MVLLVDPLPTLRESIERETFIRGALESPVEVSSIDNPPEAILREGDVESQDQPPIRTREHPRVQTLFLLQSIISCLSRKEKVDKGPPAKILKRPVRVFEQASSRVRLNVDSDSVFQSPQPLLNLKRQIYETNSTRDTFHQLLEQGGQVKYADGAFGVLDPLFQIVQQDMLGLLKLLNNVLQSITLEVLDDDIMEQRLSIWRQLIARAQLELPEIRRAMEKTFTFLQATDTERADASGQSGAASKEWQDMSLQIEDLVRKLQAASISLTSNMSLLDSRRSIAEAHSITKLTELAFFFIPLTFAATLFGMQVQPLESRAPLSTFILLGVTLSALSYLVRLALRSTWLRDLRQTSSKSIKAFADRKRQPVQRGDVPTSLFLKWMFHQLKLNVRRIVGSLWTGVRTSAACFTCIALMLLALFWLPGSE